jgi:hypothetical protein
MVSMASAPQHGHLLTGRESEITEAHQKHELHIKNCASDMAVIASVLLIKMD